MAASEVPANAPIWPTRANWREKVELTLEYATTIFASQNGKEQRRARRSQPRVTQSAKVSAMDAAQSQKVMRFVLENFISKIAFPDYAREYAAAVTAPQLLSPTEPARWVGDGAPVILRQGDTVEMRFVTQKDGQGRLILSAPTALTGRVLVYPVLYGVLEDELAAALLTNAVAEFDLEVFGLPGFQAPPFSGSPSAVFDGREVFTFKADWTDRSATLSQIVKTLDTGKGRVSRFAPIKFATRIYRSNFLCGTRDEIDELAAFFVRCKGRQKEFFVSTDLRDLTPLAVAGPTLTCEPTGQTGLARNRVDRAVAIRRKTGETSYHKVTNLTEAGSQMNLTLSPAAGVAPDGIDAVSWLPLARFASDRLVIPFETTHAARIDLTIQTLEYLPAES